VRIQLDIDDAFERQCAARRRLNTKQYRKARGNGNSAAAETRQQCKVGGADQFCRKPQIGGAQADRLLERDAKFRGNRAEIDLRDNPVILDNRIGDCRLRGERRKRQQKNRYCNDNVPHDIQPPRWSPESFGGFGP
jgi:hypothetical protein